MNLPSPALPPLTELDAFLADRESRVSGLRPECAAGVVWSPGGPGVRTPISVVYLPGYTATRGETAPVADRVADALGANLFYARLTGHGTGFEGHRTCTLDDWKRDGREAFEVGRLLGHRVVLIGTSTGGTVASWLVLGPAQVRPAATVLISPNFGPKDRSSELLTWPGREWILKKVVGERTGFPPANPAHELYWDTDHHSHSLLPMMALVAETRRLRFDRWPGPVLTVADDADPVVEPKITRRLMNRCPEGTWSRWTAKPGDHSHVLAGDILSPGGTAPMTDLLTAWLTTKLA